MGRSVHLITGSQTSTATSIDDKPDKTESSENLFSILRLPQIETTGDGELVLTTALRRGTKSLRMFSDRPTYAISRLDFCDSLGRYYPIPLFDCALLSSEFEKRISIPLDIPRNQILFQGLALSIEILSDDERYLLKYTFQNQRKVTMEDVIFDSLKVEDRDRLFEIIREVEEQQRQQTRKQTENKTKKSEKKQSRGLPIERQNEQSSVDIEEPLSFQDEEKRSEIDSDILTDLDEDNAEDNDNALITTLDQYSDAIYREIAYLQENGNRQYKAINGRFMCECSGYYCYSFDLETKLYIADDAPIRLTISGNTVKGAVLVCEGSRIIIVVTTDLGRRVSTAMISAEPWRLLEKLDEKFREINSKHQIAYYLTEDGPILRTNDGGKTIAKGQQAAYHHVDENEITVIWGPPGTNKTYVMSMIALNAMRRGERVLIVSHSNTSVDDVIKATADRFRENGMDTDLRQGKVLRYGYIRDESLAEDSDIVAFNYALGQMPEERHRMEELREERDKYSYQSNYAIWRRMNADTELKKVRLQVRSREKVVARNADILGTTISRVLVDPIFNDNEYDLVMFDEASAAYVPQLVVAASYASKRFVCAGDFCQSAPIAQSETHSTLCTDIFTYLGINRNGRIYAHPWLVMLNEQCRMHPAISRFLNRYMYHKLLVDHESVIHGRDTIVERAPIPGEAMQLIDLNGTFCAAMKNQNDSRFNILSAIVSYGTALQAYRCGEQDIEIISPYETQARLIRAMVRDNAEPDPPAISCKSVHQAHGSERNVIVFDAVESYPDGGMRLSNNENNAVTLLVNAAMTRARGKFITVANSGFWKNKTGKTSNTYGQLLGYLQDNHLTTSMDEERALQQNVDSLEYGSSIMRYISLVQAMERLRQDIERSKKQIIVSLPDGQREPGSPVIDLLQAARARGVRVICKARDYRNLPEDWKDFAYASDNAVFPLIVIDEKVVWYGLPEFTGQFTDGEWMSQTIIPMMYRIQGRYTVSMICSLTDIEHRVFKGERSVLEEKGIAKATTQTRHQASVNYKGQDIDLANYMQQNIPCAKCGNPTELTRGYKGGRIYLRCPSCGNTDYLRKV